MTDERRPLRLTGPAWAVWRTRPVFNLVVMTVVVGATGLASTVSGALAAVVATLLITAVVGGFVATGRREAVAIDATGVTDIRLFRPRHWSWDEVVVVSTSAYGGGNRNGEAVLVVCLRDDPYPKVLKGLPTRNGLDAADKIAAIARAGWPVDARHEAAETWWYLDPRRTQPRG